MAAKDGEKKETCGCLRLCCLVIVDVLTCCVTPCQEGADEDIGEGTSSQQEVSTMTRCSDAAMTRGFCRLLTDCLFHVLSAPNEPTSSRPSNPKRSDRRQRFVCPVSAIFRIFSLHV